MPETNRVLQNKPLIEAIFELRWDLSEIHSSTQSHYKILPGIFFDRFKKEYPIHQPLPSTTIPDELAQYIVQHRFRKSHDGWPLIQLGNGIVTLNDTSKYSWPDFSKRILNLTKALFDSYPSDDQFKIVSAHLRFINALSFDFGERNIFEFLEQEMKVRAGLDDQFFRKTGVSKAPHGFNLQYGFPTNKPHGSIQVGFSHGQKQGEDALIWDLIVLSAEGDAPKSANDITRWVKQAHTLAEDWFFMTLSEDLRRKFA